MMHKFARKQPRFHPGLEWEGRNLSNDFVDVSRMALDDSFSGKNAAPLSKRRNGIGYTDGKTQGLFGVKSNPHCHCGGARSNPHCHCGGGIGRTRYEYQTVMTRGGPVKRRVPVFINGIENLFFSTDREDNQDIQQWFEDPRTAYFIGGAIAVGAYTVLDYLTYNKNQSQLRRMINRTPSSLIVGAVAFSLFAPISA